MPEIRASLSIELHRNLKEEAAREGLHLKDLLAKILENTSKISQVANDPESERTTLL